MGTLREFAFVVFNGCHIISVQSFGASDDVKASAIALQWALDDFSKYESLGADSFVLWDVDCDRLICGIPFV